jgi:hypothetical protein
MPTSVSYIKSGSDIPPKFDASFCNDNIMGLIALFFLCKLDFALFFFFVLVYFDSWDFSTTFPFFAFLLCSVAGPAELM